jgi:hypothetical protein
MGENGLNWFCWDGGTDIILPERLLSAWEGGNAPSNGRVVIATFRCDPHAPATDYDRACSVEASIASIPVGDGAGIVVSDAPLLTWIPNGDGGYLVVALGWHDLTDDLVTQVAKDTPLEEFGQPGFMFQTSDSRLRVLAAADTFDNEYGYGYMPIELSPGMYRITTAVRRLNDIEQFMVHRFQRV